MGLETTRLWPREFVPEDWRAVLAYHCDPRDPRFYDPSEWDDSMMVQPGSWQSRRE